MLPTLPSLSRLLMLAILSLTGAMQTHAVQGNDPLKDLVDGLRLGHNQSTEEWLDVLSAQPRKTTSTLVQVLQEDGNDELLSLLRTQLREVCAFAAIRHGQDPWTPIQWDAHSRLSMEIVALLGRAAQAQHLIQLLSVPAGGEDKDYDTSSFLRPLKHSLLQACERDAMTLRVIQKAYGSKSHSLDSQLLRTLGS